MVFSRIIGTGSYLPDKLVTNDDMAKLVDTSDEWITERTGIKQRYFADEAQKTSDLAYNAAIKALESANVKAEDLDAILVATTTPDRIFPATATKLQSLLKNKKAYAFDIQAVCAGFVYGITVADAMIKAGNAKKVLLVGAETFSRILDFKDRTTCVLFGDGAGAVVLEATEDNPTNAGVSGIIGSSIFSDGDYNDILYCDLNSSVSMKGQEVFKHAVEKLSKAIDAVLDKTKMQATNIDFIVPHQANLRILKSLVKKMNIKDEQLVITVDKHANTSAASIPLALDYAVKAGQIKKGHTILIEAIGGGLSWGASIIRM